MSDLTPNNDQLLQNPYPEDEIDLKELIMVLWSGKWLISAVSGLAAAISVVVALSLPNIYTASALLAPAESGGGGLSGLMKQYGGLASLAGVSLPGGEEGSRAQLGMQLMQSRAFIADFVDRRDIFPSLWPSSRGARGQRKSFLIPSLVRLLRKNGSVRLRLRRWQSHPRKKLIRPLLEYWACRGQTNRLHHGIH